MPKKYIGINVLDAAKERISWTFDNFEEIIISFSGGKDSTVMTHLVMEEAIKRDKKVKLFFLDWECQFTHTINHVRSIFNLYSSHIDPYWVALPIMTDNACSQYEPTWKCWDEEKMDLWVRDIPKEAIVKSDFFPFYFKNMTFEEFTPLFAKWISRGKDTANFIGIRTQESLNRFRAITKDITSFEGQKFTTKIVDNCWSVYPIYDWNTEDVWVYNYKTKLPYNKLYDLMHKAGLTIHQMRIDEPFGDTSRRGLWLYQIIEPKMWAKLVARVSGANTVNEYGRRKGNILGNQRISLPKGHTWKSFAMYLLHTMPPKTAEHYRNKIAKYIQWYKERGYPDGIPDEADPYGSVLTSIPF